MKYNIKKIIIGSRESKLAKAHVEIFKVNFYRKFEKNSIFQWFMIIFHK